MPLWPFALAALGPIWVAYFLRRRYPPRKVSALFLWRSPHHRVEAGRKFDRLSREVSLALETAAVVLAALFLAGHGCSSATVSRRLVVVLDGSFSMQATDAAGQRASARAVAEVEALLRRTGATEVTLIESGLTPIRLVPALASSDAARKALASWVPRRPHHDVWPSLVLARESLLPGQRVLLVTDGAFQPVSELPTWVERLSVGAAAANLGFTGCVRRAGAAQVSVLNSGAAAARAVLRVEAGARPPQDIPLEVPAGRSLAVSIPASRGDPLRLSLPADALDADNELRLLPEPDPTLNVEFSSALGPAPTAVLRRALQATGEVRFESPADLKVGALEGSGDVRVGLMGEPATFVGPFVKDATEPLLDDVDTVGLVWRAGKGALPGRAVLSVGEVTLMSVDGEVVRLNVDLERGNLGRHTAWPVLVANHVRQARSRAPGFSAALFGASDAVGVTAPPTGACEVVETGADGVVVRHALSTARRVELPPLEHAAALELRCDNHAVAQASVISVDATESDLAGRSREALVHEDAVVGEAAAAAGPSHPELPLVLMVACLLGDALFLLRRRA